jgi:hypothetical protein
MVDLPESSSDDPNEALRQILAHFSQAEQARVTTASTRVRGVLIPRLAQHGIANVEAAYSGYGDSGAIDGLQFRDRAGVRVERANIPDSLIEELESCFYEFLPAGFEINDGGQGTLTLDTQTAKVTIKHQENYTESRDSTREFDL